MTTKEFGRCLSGSPRTCSPLWTATTGGIVDSSPAVAGGVVYVGSADGKLYAFDAAGVSGCSGTPTTCLPLWTTSIVGIHQSSPAVANGLVYIGLSNGQVDAFDANGATNCSGTPKTCIALWSSAAAGALVDSGPVVVNGHVYFGSNGGGFFADGLP
jgi:outer membrane protein assembly factor BamB